MEAHDAPTEEEHQPLLEVVNVVVHSPWLYPFKGIYYVCSHRWLWPLIESRIIPCLTLSIVVFTLLFAFTYLPQVAVYAIFYGRALAWVNAAILVLGEGAVIIAILFEAFLVDKTNVDVFDAILIHEGLDDLVLHGRDLHPPGEDINPVQRLGPYKLSPIYSPFDLRQMCEFVLLLPLSFFPLFGLPIFIILTGYRAGPLQHYRWFVLRDLKRSERKREVKERQRKYTWFGSVHLALQLVPGLSMLFLVTTAAGAAMWAAKLEKKRRIEALAKSVPPVPGRATYGTTHV